MTTGGELGKNTRDRTEELSPQQRRLWVLHHLFPTLPLYNSPYAYHLTGRVDTALLEDAVRAVIRAHESLRTSFPVHGDSPVRLIADATEFSLPVHELAADGDEVRQAARRVCDLSRPGAFDIRLFRLADDGWVLLVNLHHIITDAVSNQVVIEDIAAAYSALLAGGEPEIQGSAYSEYAERFAARLAGGLAERQLDYWAEALDGVPPLLNLPTDRPRPAEQQFEGSLLDFSLDAETTAGLTRLAREQRMTPYMVLLGVIGLFLYGHTHERDIPLGVPVSHRNDPAFERTVGFFVNFVVLRSRFRPELTVRGYLDEVRAACIQAFRNQDVPFDDVIQRLDLQGALSHSPLAQVVVNYHHQAPPPPDFPGLKVRRESVLTGYVQTDLEFDLTVQADGSTSGTIAYAEALFDHDTISRFADRLRVFARRVVEAADTSLAALDFCTEAEAAAVEQWNATTADFPDNLCLHEMFEAQAARTPEATAVVHGTDALSYRELDEQADALAARLSALGIGPDDVVGVRIDRSCELVVALIGVLKAGAAYLPLDTGTPGDRVRKILDDARASIVVQSDGSPPLPERVRAVAPVDPKSVPAARPTVPPHPDNLVSVYYTSGSTGTPKGVASTHRGWVNRMVWMQKKHQLQPGETVLHKTTLTFDDAALEIFWPLGTGGRVAILDPGEHRDPRAVLRAAEHYRTVYLQVVPSMLIAMLDELELAPESAPRSLRNTTSSGEALYPATVERFHRLLPGLLHNTWGATEVSIDSTCHTCGPEDEAGNAPVSLGLPFDNNTVHVLSAELRPVPVGVVGDLYIGGVGLARGYLNDPARTASAFVADPWNPGQRLYRTGDQGYRRPDGRVRFMGRNDHQIKIRGMRVELGEIEVTLQRHPSVRDAVVLVQGSGTALRLVAFATPVRPGAEVDANDVLAHAQQWLPEHMVPWRLVVLESFPLNNSGKIDRRAVKMPEVAPDVPAERLPSSSSEIFVAGLWTELLDVEQIGLDDNFFTLGGHSLTATQFTARVRQRLGVDLPLVALYTDPTVSGVAERLEDLVAEQLYPADAGT